MHFRVFFIIVFSLSFLLQGLADHELQKHPKPKSPFSVALETLQKQIGYDFQSVGLLRRAMTHPSFSEESNRAFSILGINVIEASVSLRSLVQNTAISAKELNRRIIDVAELNSCAADGSRLGLDKIVRVSPKTNSSTPSVVCGAFRAIFGAIAVDTGMTDAAGELFWNVHGGDVGALGI